MFISVGFDGTCVTNDFPKMGKEIGAAEALHILVLRGHKIVLLTKRWNRSLDEALKWFKRNGIPLYGLHSTANTYKPSSVEKIFIPGGQKPYENLYPDLYIGVHADVYIDSHAVGCPLIHGDHKKPYVDWVKVLDILDTYVG